MHERAFETQKKALYTRFSQALPLLPSLNGYGEYSETKNEEERIISDNTAESFIRVGLSKVMKITNICDSEHLTDCGLPDKIIPVNGGTAINLSSITTIKNYNNLMGILKTTEDDNLNWSNTFAAAFETVNGESVLVYYNPNCENDLKELGTTWYFSQPKMCANFIYDLNGKKGPNTVGKDIGIITALYATDPVVVAPHFYPYSTDKYNYGDAIEICKSDNDKKMPNISEAMSIFYNKKLFGVTNAGAFWSSSIKASNAIWSVSFDNGKMGTAGKSDQRKAICVKR